MNRSNALDLFRHCANEGKERLFAAVQKEQCNMNEIT
jgi:hypothetical protein